MEFSTQTKIGDIAAHHPLATRVFARHGIDFCCGGGVPLAKACERRQLDPDAIVLEIEATLGERTSEGSRWLEAPLEDLVAHIVKTYHEPLREELPRLEEMAFKVARVHGERRAEIPLDDLATTVSGLVLELEGHMRREEESLFPQLLDSSETAATEDFVDDHEEAGRALARIRELTGGFQLPEGACNTWRALWHGLQDLELAMHEHVHLENNILFPRAIGSATGL